MSSFKEKITQALRDVRDQITDAEAFLKASEYDAAASSLLGAKEALANAHDVAKNLPC